MRHPNSSETCKELAIEENAQFADTKGEQIAEQGNFPRLLRSCAAQTKEDVNGFLTVPLPISSDAGNAGRLHLKFELD